MHLRHDPQAMRSISNAADFGRVAVMLGGTSTEREISLISGRAVLAALQRRGVDAHAFDPAEHALSELQSAGYARAWIALHGPGGEDGTLQGALEFLGIPYTGSGVMGSAIGMDKLRTKRLAHAIAVPTAEFVVLRSVADAELAAERLGLPLIVKPATQGSSVGMTRVTERSQLRSAYAAATLHDRVAFAEPWRIHGGDPEGRGAAVHPHPDAAYFL